MGKNILITFVSVFSGPFDLRKEPDKYSYGKDGNFVTGRQTNEAPLKFLLINHTEINEIICLVSDTANKPSQWNSNIKISVEEFTSKMGTDSPYVYLKKQVNQFVKEHPESFPNGKTFLFKKVTYNEKEEYFPKTIIPEILQRIHPGDTIYLDTTGGFRYNQTQMTLLAKILSYQGTKLNRAVYSEFTKKEIYDVTDSFRDFDLVNGLNEFGSTGATGMLESYFKDTVASSKTVVELVQAMKELNETIILGRISKIQNKTDNMKKKLESAKNELDTQKDNPILAVLLPIFRNKYEQLSSTPELIKWCAANNLIQLAFTLYSDWLPHFIMKEEKIISFTGTLSDEVENKIKKLKFNYSTYILRYIFINQIDGSIYVKALRHYTKDGYVKVIEKLDELSDSSKRAIGDFTYKDSVENGDLKKMLQDYAYAVTIRNEINHASSNEADSLTSITEDKKIQDRKEYLAKQGYVFDEDKLDIDTLKQFLTDSMNRILELAKRK